MSDYPIPASAIEAAYDALDAHADRAGEGWQNGVEAAVRAAFDDLGMEEVREGRFDPLDKGPPEKRQFRSRWLPVEEP